jgi:bacteriocin biosynthesis cyclodehydratase domain-containing protein
VKTPSGSAAASQLAPEDRLLIAPGTRVHVVDDDSGFLEEPAGVRRIQGERLRAAVTEVLGPLSAPRTVAEVLGGLSDLSQDEGLSWLGELLDAGLVHRPSADRTATVLLAGDPSLLACSRVAFGADVEVIERLRDDSPEHPRPALPAADLTVVLAGSLFDRWAEQLAAACVELGRPFLVAAADPGRGAFVTPVWRPGESLACFDCVRIRLHANAPTGRTRWEYQRSLTDGDGDGTGDGDGVGSAGIPPEQAARLGLAAALAGARAAQWLARTSDAAAGSVDDLLWVDATLALSRRPVLPVPTCRWCRIGSDHQSADPDGAAARREPAGLEAAADEICGIVHSASVRTAETGPRVQLSGSVAADNSLIAPSLRVTLNGGAGFTRRSALLATLGETVERYAAGLFRRADLVLSSYAGLDEPAVAPEVFALYSPEQYGQPGFPYAPFTADTVVRWVRAVRQRDGAVVRVPASQVYLPYRRVRGEEEFAPCISTGMAAGPSMTAATLSGLQEVVERDALAISWLHRLPPRPVAEEAVAQSSDLRHALGRRSSWSVRFHDLSLDLDVPVIAAVMRYRHDREDILSFGSACRGDVTAAAEKAFLEAAQGLTYVRRLLRAHADWECAPDFSNVDDFNKHAILYTKYPTLRERAGYLVAPGEAADAAPDGPAAAGRTPRPVDAPGPDAGPETDHDRLTRIVQQLAALGYETYVVDLTTPDVAALGVRVVRVMVPGLQHLSGIHARRFLGGRRLLELPGQLLAADVGTSAGSCPDNPFPHPLP